VVRYVLVAYHDSPGVIEYPDEGRVIVVAWTPDANGERLFREFRDSAGD
jgi:acetoacetate decarboxylase